MAGTNGGRGRGSSRWRWSGLGRGVTTALAHLNACGARTSAQAKFSVCVCVCVPYLFSFQDFGTPLETLGLPAGLACPVLPCPASLCTALCLCLVELAFYICFNFLAISCILPLALSPSLSASALCPVRVYCPHLSVKWRWRKARGTLNVQLPLGLLSVGSACLLLPFSVFITVD